MIGELSAAPRNPVQEELDRALRALVAIARRDAGAVAPGPLHEEQLSDCLVDCLDTAGSFVEKLQNMLRAIAAIPESPAESEAVRLLRIVFQEDLWEEDGAAEVAQESLQALTTYASSLDAVHQVVEAVKWALKTPSNESASETDAPEGDTTPP